MATTKRKEAGVHLKRLLRQYKIRRNAVAEDAGINPAYVTLMTRDGAVPSDGTCVKMVRSLIKLGAPRLEAERWMLLCGRVPPSLLDASDALLDAVLSVCQRPVMAQRTVAKTLRNIVSWQDGSEVAS